MRCKELKILKPILDTIVFPYRVTSGTPARITSFVVDPQL